MDLVDKLYSEFVDSLQYMSTCATVELQLGEPSLHDLHRVTDEVTRRLGGGFIEINILKNGFVEFNLYRRGEI